MKRPGLGWKHINGAVWDHTTGIRIYVGGICRLPCGRVVVGNQWPESKRLRRAVREQGGNWRRGTMVWALDRLADS